MIFYTTMNWQARVDRYLNRGFERAAAEILVLMEESASALFSAFPDRFLLFGGATLVLFYDSPRLSRDIDLLPKAENLPSMDEVQMVLDESLQALSEAFGLGRIEYQRGVGLKIWVKGGERLLFSIEFTRIAGAALDSGIVRKSVGEDREKVIVTLSANHLLLQKCEAFLARRAVKARDAFDIHLLLSRGAALDDNLTAHLADFIRMREFDAEFLHARIDRVNAKLCTVELRAVLPSELFNGLSQEGFKPLRQALETLFADWL